MVDPNTKDEYGITALMYAADLSRFNVVKELINTPGIDINIKDKNGDTALIWATQSNDYETLRVLINAPGIDLNATNNEGKTALMTASFNNRGDGFKAIRELIVAPGKAGFGG